MRHRRGDRTVLGLLIPPAGAAVIGVAALASAGLGLGVLGVALYTAVGPDMPSSLALTLTGSGLIMAGGATQALYAGGRARSVLVAPRVSRGGVGLGVGGAF